MAFRQVKDLIRWTSDFHETLGAQYHHLAAEQQDERMAMTLTFLASREDRMRESMANYLRDGEPRVLEIWLTDSQDFVHPRMLERIPKCMGCHDSQDILANVMTAHQTLKDMYQLRSELAQLPEEKSLFEQLAKNQDAEARLQTRDIARFEIS